VTILPVSARTGEGVAELYELLAGQVAGRRAAMDRLDADVDRVAAALSPLIGLAVEGVDGDPIPEGDRERALAGLRAAAGVSSLADAVCARAAAYALPLVSTPLRSLGALWRKEADPSVQRAAGPEAPAAVPVDRGGLDQVLSHFANALATKLPEVWGRALRAQIVGSRRDVAEQLDLALSQCELAAVDSARAGTRAARVGHVLLLLLAVAGVIAGAGGAVGLLPGFCAGIGAAGLVLGLLGSVLLDVRARASARARAIRSGQVAAASLAVELAAVAQDGLFAPAAAELDRHRRAYEAFATVYG
jgi:hypothetical protein